MTLLAKDHYSVPDNGAKNLLGPNDIYKFTTLLPKDYFLIPGNGAKNLLRPNDIYKFTTLLPKDYFLVLDNGTKNLFTPNITCMLIRRIILSLNSIKDLIWP